MRSFIGTLKTVSFQPRDPVVSVLNAYFRMLFTVDVRVDSSAGTQEFVTDVDGIAFESTVRRARCRVCVSISKHVHVCTCLQLCMLVVHVPAPDVCACEQVQAHARRSRKLTTSADTIEFRHVAMDLCRNLGHEPADLENALELVFGELKPSSFSETARSVQL